MRKEFLIGTLIYLLIQIPLAYFFPVSLFALILFGPILFLGYIDFFQLNHTIRRNYPVLGRFRYFFEFVSPEIQQYFIESYTEGLSFSKEQRNIVYQRAKKALDTLPFGTQLECRNADRTFSEKLFEENANRPSVKMIELKLSQGAKPGHGGILPAAKITPEISKIRQVPMDQDVVSPSSHSTFSTPIEMMEFIQRLRELSGSKPVGIKICIGKRREFLALCKAMVETKILPDFIFVDGGEGGTGAVPLEFTNRMGAPGNESLIFVHNSLMGYGLRENIKVIGAGKLSQGFNIIKLLALGADLTYAARPMMFALGCIHLLGAMGLNHPEELRPWHVMRRISKSYARANKVATAQSFESI